MARQIRNVFIKLTELFFKMYHLPEFLRYKNDLLVKLTGQNVDRSYQSVFKQILGFGFSIIKKKYFDPISGVSIPGFESHIFESYINLQLKSPCRSVWRVLS